MGMTGTAGNAVGKRRHRRHAVISDINVTPMVDVMLVLLIVFMVSAPLLTVGVPVDLPQTQAKSLDKGQEPLVVSVTTKGDVFLQSSDTPTPIEDLVTKIKAVTDARGAGPEERIYVRADRKADWGAVMSVMGRLSSAGFHKVALVTEVERGS
jgi:biopolymer transport protein TolR